MANWDPYDRMGAGYRAHAVDSAYNAHYDRPAVLDSAGDVRGLDVLDAACGPGLYLAELLARGARVRAFDASREMVELARAVADGAAQIEIASLDSALPYDTAAFDLVLCALAIHYSDDRAATFAEFFRVVRPGGRCVVSTQHPTINWLRKGGSYFDAVLETDVWRTADGPAEVRFWREPLTDLCRAATDAGFLIERIVEPRPAESMRTEWPEDYDTLNREPGFLILELVKVH